MTNKKWFQILAFLILAFLLIYLINATSFVFQPLANYLGAVAFPIIGAGLLYYLTRPLMHLFEKWGVGRIWSIILVFVTIIVVIALFILYIWPIAQRQVMNLVSSIPGMVVAVENFIYYVQANYTIPEQAITAIEDFMNNLPTIIENVASTLFGFLGNVIGQVVAVVVGIVMIPFVLFFMMKDGHKMVPFLTQFFSRKKADNLRSWLGKLDDQLGSFIQGQLIVSLSVGVMIYIGYVIIGLDYALMLALFGIITNVIPYVGPYLAVAPALIIGAFQDPLNLIWVSLIMLAAQQIESNLISPNVMGQKLNIHPLTIFTLIFAAGSIAGLLGMLFAVPTYALIRTTIAHFYGTYVGSKKEKEDALF